ncbi:MAG: class I SAM-dependent methyltransferase [bacterium]|nr:class I SAM-dependent methyltransferase [bacterium]
MKKTYGYGNFGNLGEEYKKARKGFPQESVDWLWSALSTENPRILDTGCGTGISTRQIAEKGRRVMGSDGDPLMIEKAKEFMN